MQILRNILAVIAGLIVGSTVNMGLIMLSGQVIAPPEGADVTTVEGLTASIHLFEPKHFIFPFLAHSLGTFVGALVAIYLTPKGTKVAAYTIGVAFLIGGSINVYMLPAPLWFNVLDLVLAYLPMAWLAHKLASPKSVVNS